jgi:photoactive yellow protein
MPDAYPTDSPEASGASPFRSPPDDASREGEAASGRGGAPPPAGRDDAEALAWYRARWRELADILHLSGDDEVVPAVRELQADTLARQAGAIEQAGLAQSGEAARVLHRLHERLTALRRENEVLREAFVEIPAHANGDGLRPEAIEALPPAVRPAAAAAARLCDLFDADGLPAAARLAEADRQALDAIGLRRAAQAASMIESMESQLDELYREKEAMEASNELDIEGDTFEQLQALMAREEMLRRELGVSSSEEVVEMVQGLASQLDEIYGAQAEETERADTDALEGEGGNLDTFEQLQALLRREETLQRELGVSDPQSVVAMVQGLADQLEDLYAARERLSKVNLDDTEGVIEMVSSMQQQLEALYAGQEILSEHGIYSVEHAMTMIESMETQLEELYREKKTLMDQGVDDPAEATERLRELETQLATLRREKEALLERREALRREKEAYAATVKTLRDRLGTSDATTITTLIASMEEQLVDLYREREADEARSEAAAAAPAPAETAPAEPAAPPSAAPPAPEAIDDVPETTDDVPEEGALLPPSTRRRLDDLDANALDNLGVAALALDDNGHVLRLNRAAVRLLPGLDDDADPRDFEGQHFFFDLAPGANNSLFRGRFRQGVDAGTLDERFAYTLISRAARPLNLKVHLYRPPAHDANWVLLRAT